MNYKRNLISVCVLAFMLVMSITVPASASITGNIGGSAPVTTHSASFQIRGETDSGSVVFCSVTLRGGYNYYHGKISSWAELIGVCNYVVQALSYSFSWFNGSRHLETDVGFDPNVNKYGFVELGSYRGYATRVVGCQQEHTGGVVWIGGCETAGL